MLDCLRQNFLTLFITSLVTFQESSTALLAAASAGHGAIVTILLLARADKNFADKVRYSLRTPENIRIVIDASCDT